MNAITIRVNKQMDGVTFSIGPSIRELIKRMFPNAHPASNIFVGYDTYSDFKADIGRLEPYIYPALLGVDDKNDLNKLGEIEFVDTFTGKELFKVTPGD